MAVFNDLNDFNLQDEELLNNLAQSGAILSFEEIQAGTTRGNSFDVLNVSGSFEDISQEIAAQGPFGKESFFAVKDGRFSTEPMDVNKLLYDIASYNEDNKRIDYNFLRYRIPFGTKDKKFETENITYDVNVKLNTLEGIIDFGQNPFFRFKINVRTQKTSYELLYAFTNYKDSKDENRYAIILSLSKGTDFISVLTFLDKKLVEKSEKRILEEYEKAFKDAHNKSEVLDFLYETAPGFVLEKRDEKLLYSDLKLLADKRIDIFGTNENIAIINIINALKESKWFYDQINTDPTVVRKLFKKFSQRYIEDLIISFVNLGLSIWNEEDLQDAMSYRIESERLDFEDNNSHLRVAYWTIYLDSKKEYKIGYTAHIFDNYDISARESKVVDLATVKPFAPLEISLGEDDTLFIPTFVGEYFTDQQIAEDRSIILNNIAAGILPELTLARIRPIINLRIYRLKNPVYNKILSEYKSGQISRVFAKYLTLEEEAVLRFYTTNAGYKNFNKALRGEIPMTQEFKLQSELMNKALDKLPKYQSNEMLYRIENLAESEINRIYKVGKTIENKHFTSSTYDYNALRDAVLNRQFTVIIRIKGKNGRLIEELSTLKTEKEILFKSHSKFTVEKIGNTINPLDPNNYTNYIKEIILIEK